MVRDKLRQNYWLRLDFYMAYNFFRIAAILHGVAQRAVDGNASASDAAENGQKSGLLAEIGLGCVGIA